MKRFLTIEVGTILFAVILLGAYWVNSWHTGSLPELQQSQSPSPATPPPVSLAITPSNTASNSPGPTEARQVTKPPEIIGAFNPREDGAEFIAIPVLNECGTYAKPEECVVKEVRVATPENYGISSYIIHQVTVKLQEGGFETFACATDIYNWDDQPPGYYKPKIWNCSEDYDGNYPLYDASRVVGQKYRFGRENETITFRPDGNNSKHVYYFMTLGKCASVHECQDIPRQIVFANQFWESVAPRAWDRYRRYWANQRQLSSPR